MARVSTSLGAIGFVERGQGADAPILFLHGVGSDKSVWNAQIDHFGRSRRAVAFDFPGYAESDPVADGCTRDEIAEMFVAAMDALAIDRAHVCGLSLGGVMAIAIYHAAPARCASLVIANSFAAHPQGQAIYDRSVELSQTSGMRAIAEQRAPILLANSTPAEVRDDVIETMASIDPAAYRLAARAVWLAGQRDRAAAISVPTLILVGSEDPVTPPALSRELAELVPGARYVELAGASHLSNLDQSEQFNRAVERFLSEAEQVAG
ncbi:MAG TPA: alpha/beta fold hydrolase [Sphingomicrobium sp.]|nr:alpha/beta fold hydrolase [Sphingomicrobium sp.]